MRFICKWLTMEFCSTYFLRVAVEVLAESAMFKVGARNKSKSVVAHLAINVRQRNSEHSLMIHQSGPHLRLFVRFDNHIRAMLTRVSRLLSGCHDLVKESQPCCHHGQQQRNKKFLINYF